MIKLGDAVYFKKAKKSQARRSTEYGFQGHGFGIFLGSKSPQDMRDMNSASLFQLMGGCGFCTFDSVAEIMGWDETQAREFIDKWTTKFYGKVIKPGEQLELPIETPSSLVDIGGQVIPIIKNETVPLFKIVTPETEDKDEDHAVAPV